MGANLANAMAKVEEHLAESFEALPTCRRKNEKVELDGLALERQRRIVRLTELCDWLLEHGVNAYQSTREQLALDVILHEKKKSQDEKCVEEVIDPDDDPVLKILAELRGQTSNTASSSATGAGDKSLATKAKEVCDAAESMCVRLPDVKVDMIFENKRCSPAIADATNEFPLLKDLLAVDTNNGRACNATGAEEEQSQARISEFANTSEGLFWQYQWCNNSEQTYGPFDSLTMHGWIMQGCFSNEQATVVRQCNKDNNPREQCWHRYDEVNFDLYL